jgi:hypothetical protein
MNWKKMLAYITSMRPPPREKGKRLDARESN